MTFNSNSSPVLQLVIVLGSHHQSKTDSLIQRILDWEELQAYESRVEKARKDASLSVAAPSSPQARSWIDDMIRDQCSSHVLEVMLKYSSGELYS